MGAVLCLVLLILLINALAVAFLRYKARQTVATESEQLQRHVFGALGKPLYVLIWICGIYLAAMPLIAEVAAGRGIAGHTRVV